MIYTRSSNPHLSRGTREDLLDENSAFPNDVSDQRLRHSNLQRVLDGIGRIAVVTSLLPLRHTCSKRMSCCHDRLRGTGYVHLLKEGRREGGWGEGTNAKIIHLGEILPSLIGDMCTLISVL